MQIEDQSLHNTINKVYKYSILESLKISKILKKSLNKNLTASKNKFIFSQKFEIILNQFRAKIQDLNLTILNQIGDVFDTTLKCDADVLRDITNPKLQKYMETEEKDQNLNFFGICENVAKDFKSKENQDPDNFMKREIEEFIKSSKKEIKIPIEMKSTDLQLTTTKPLTITNQNKKIEKKKLKVPEKALSARFTNTNITNLKNKFNNPSKSLIN